MKTAPKRWSDAEVAMMEKRVSESPRAVDGLKAHAEQHGRSLGTVQQKYYTIRRAKVTDQKAQAKLRREQQRAVKSPSVNVQAMSDDAIMDLASDLKSEIVRRKEELAAQAKRAEAQIERLSKLIA